MKPMVFFGSFAILVPAVWAFEYKFFLGFLAVWPVDILGGFPENTLLLLVRIGMITGILVAISLALDVADIVDGLSRRFWRL
jgi:hypothetical protein